MSSSSPAHVYGITLTKYLSKTKFLRRIKGIFQVLCFVYRTKIQRNKQLIFSENPRVHQVRNERSSEMMHLLTLVMLERHPDSDCLFLDYYEAFLCTSDVLLIVVFSHTPSSIRFVEFLIQLIVVRMNPGTATRFFH